MIKELQKRGRKAIPESKKKKAVIVYLTTEQTDVLGGIIETSKLLQSFAEFKIKKLLKNKQNEETINSTTGI